MQVCFALLYLCLHTFDVCLQVPLAPPEDILSWLYRIGLIEEEEEATEEESLTSGGDSLLDDEFDLDEEAGAQGVSGLAEMD